MDERSLSSSALSNTSKLPWYDRRILEGITTQFGPAPKDKFTVFLTQDAVIDLHIGTFQQAPSEAFGLLMGRVYTDDIGTFTVVERAVYARKLEAGPGHVQVSPEAIHELRLQATRKHPAMDFVGWTHSHSEISSYSEIDYQEQKTWDENYHIGILTFMEGVMGIRRPWAVTYRGPSAQPLPFVRDAAPTLRKNNKLPPLSQETQRMQEPITSQETQKLQNFPTSQGNQKIKVPPISPVKPGEQEPASGTKERPSQASSKWFSPRINKNVFFSAFFTIALVIIGVVLGNFILLGLQPVIPTSSSTNLLWDCNQQSGTAPLSVTCTGPVGPNIRGWAWYFGDGTTTQKSTVTHLYSKPGMYRITLIVISSTNQQTGTYNINAGSLTIEVAPKGT